MSQDSLMVSQRIKRYYELVELWKVCPSFTEDHDVHYKTKRVGQMPLTTEPKEVIEEFVRGLKL